MDVKEPAVLDEAAREGTESVLKSQGREALQDVVFGSVSLRLREQGSSISDRYAAGGHPRQIHRVSIRHGEGSPAIAAAWRAAIHWSARLFPAVNQEGWLLESLPWCQRTATGRCY